MNLNLETRLLERLGWETALSSGWGINCQWLQLLRKFSPMQNPLMPPAVSTFDSSVPTVSVHLCEVSPTGGWEECHWATRIVSCKPDVVQRLEGKGGGHPLTHGPDKHQHKGSLKYSGVGGRRGLVSHDMGFQPRRAGRVIQTSTHRRSFSLPF